MPPVDHAPVNRGVITDSPHLEEACHRRKKPVQLSGRMDETSMLVKGRSRAIAPPISEASPHQRVRIQQKPQGSRPRSL